MSNRFAWAWKLADRGKPVVLIYLGFLHCEDMHNGVSQKPISDGEDWQKLVEAHSRILFDAQIWNKEWQVNGQPFIPLIRTYDQPLATI